MKALGGRSREGAWIEMVNNKEVLLCLTKRRSREGAWIEIDFALYYLGEFDVAPVRERGLKY